MKSIVAATLVTLTALAMVVTSASAEGAAAVPGKKLIGAQVKIKADQVDAFIAAAKPMLAASRAEPGCISYTLYQDPYDRTSFFFFEEWKDQAAIDFHFATPHFKAFGDQIKDLVDGAPAITIYDAPTQKKPGA